MKLWQKLSRSLIAPEGAAARGKPGCRAYAIGDVHGRLDLLDILLERIEQDIAARPKVRTFIVFLGDLIDRGPDSAGVVERLRTYAPAHATPIFLGGNHEEVLLRIIKGERKILPSWLKFGGAECAQSYGIDVDALQRLDERAALEIVKGKIPQAHRRFPRKLRRHVQLRRLSVRPCRHPPRHRARRAGRGWTCAGSASRS